MSEQVSESQKCKVTLLSYVHCCIQHTHAVDACLLHSVFEVCTVCRQGWCFVSGLAFGAALLLAVLALGGGAGQAAFRGGSWLWLDIQEQGSAHSNGSIQVVTVPVWHVGSVLQSFALPGESQRMSL